MCGSTPYRRSHALQGHYLDLQAVAVEADAALIGDLRDLRQVVILESVKADVVRQPDGGEREGGEGGGRVRGEEGVVQRTDKRRGC